MSELKPVYAAAPPVVSPSEAACECGWPFGRIIRVRWRDRMRGCLVLYGTGMRVYAVQAECPVCHKIFYFDGK
jgi:hypothetical protein